VDYAVTVTVTRSGNLGSVVSNAVTIGPQTYADFIKKVVFTGSATTATVTLNNLSNKDVYLVKVNTSATQVAAANTGSVQSASPSFSLIDDGQLSPLSMDDKPRKGHPDATAFNANPPPIDRERVREETTGPRAAITPSVVGDTRTFSIQQDFIGGTWISITTTLLATGQYGNIWVYNNGITTEEAQALSAKFDIIYPAETNILGYEYGGGPGGSGGKDGDPKIQILVYDIVNASGVVQAAGFFWGKDFYEQPQIDSWNWNLKTNLAEIFYINASYVKSSPSLIYLTLAHEFQHMINFNQKFVQNSRTSDTWYDEMLSMMTEDVMADILGIPTTDQYHPIQDHISFFIETYDKVGFSEWYEAGVYPYSKAYTFGAYLMRNYGGVELLRRILANSTTNTASITAALNEISPGMTFEKAVGGFAEAMIFSGNTRPEGGLTLDKTVTSTITGYNGDYTYTLPAFDIWNTRRRNSSNYGPVIYSLTQTAMRGHTVIVQQGSGWSNRSGSFSVTFNRPSNANIEMYLIVR
jgi:hypothetical protein